MKMSLTDFGAAGTSFSPPPLWVQPHRRHLLIRQRRRLDQTSTRGAQLA